MFTFPCFHKGSLLMFMFYKCGQKKFIQLCYLNWIKKNLEPLDSGFVYQFAVILVNQLYYPSLVKFSINHF